ncbi:MAG: primosomal protein N' [Bacteroidetes bacterium]|uniref:Replication restart protein PriA n=1 Tax=Candidatus Pullibacteroides excrementavium TaxID=2840905 RepID=A0A9D9H1S7_9BACT|nr:primosomal protein N' [Candidatus Pullibacteroides excrementavium]
MSVFVDVLLPLPLHAAFTYSVPVGMQAEVKVGVRVCVPFGRSKVYAGLVRKVHGEQPEAYDLREIISVLDEESVVDENQFRFWEWMSSYYLCTEGEVMAAALPSGFKLDSETKLVLNPDFDGDISGLNEKQLDIIEALGRKPEITMEEASKAASQLKVFPLVRGLRERGVILVKEEISERYRPLSEDYIRWGDAYMDNPQAQQAVFDRVEKKSFKQLEVLMAYVSLFSQAEDGWVRRALVSGKVANAAAPLQALLKKGVLCSRKKHKSRLELLSDRAGEAVDVVLSEAQQQAFQDIKAGLAQKEVCLLHGVTSSGKTEIYIRLIQEVLEQGKQALFLLPEIALSAQMIVRLRRYFGDRVGVYHSRYNEPEKVEIWKNTGSRYQVILGARSALFLPYKNLGLVIVDEEHEGSYKQQDPAPRYHARDAAVFLAHLHGAKTVLGSATPSLESYYNALHGKYALATLFTRYGGVKLPSVLVSDLKEEKRQKSMQGIFSSLLVSKMKDALANGKQVILFQNRRGFSARLECEACGYVPVCENCDVTLTYHKHRGVLMCHYCGYAIPQMHVCPECGSPKMQLRGTGTERIEEDLSLLFPDAKVGRMDLDSTRGKGAYHKLIEDFQDRRIDILVGTQMVTKGLDFDNVAVVGIVDADSLISFPDFRSYERSFQLMTQVSGRAGRKNGGGEVVIQTYHPDYQVVIDVMNSDYASMFHTQLQDRLVFKYPPFYRLVRLSVRHKDEHLVREASEALALILRKIYGDRVLGPEYPLVARINTYYIRDILIKFERSPLIERMKQRLRECLEEFWKDVRWRRVRILVDVDPY